MATKRGPAVKPISLDGVKAHPLVRRSSKVSVEMCGRGWEKGGSFKEFLHRLPAVLAATELQKVAGRIRKAVALSRTVLLGMGAHPIKVGLSPVIIDLMSRGVLTGVALNGAGIIHDAELALAGHTSEDVAAGLVDGSFGMSQDTADFLNEAIARAARQGQGLGATVGQALLESEAPYKNYSILATGAELGLPVTVHVAIGTDVIHMHPSMDPAATGAASHLDFRVFASQVASLEGGVYLNLGSAVLLPEVFLKALTLARNLGHGLQSFTTVNMDFLPHYRPRQNVVERPRLAGGSGFELIGHHEIMLPLLAAAVIESLELQQLHQQALTKPGR